MNEHEFQKRVTDLADRFGWRWWHVPAPMRWDQKGKRWIPAKQAAGLPDLVMISADPPRLILAELKGEGGKLSDAQVEFLYLARLVAEETLEFRGNDRALGVYSWAPVDEPIVEQILRSKVLI